MMPIARVLMPNGRIGRFEVPDGTTPEQALALISSPSMMQPQTVPDPQAAGEAAATEHWQSLSPLEAGIAGAGREAVGVGRGIGQMLRGVLPESTADTLGLPSQADIDRYKEQDAGLTQRLAGRVGGALMGGALAAPAVFAPGVNTILGSAAVGAGMGALQSTASDESRLANAGIGAIGGGAGQLAGRFLPQVGRAVFSPFFRGGQESTVAETAARAAGVSPQELADAIRSGSRSLVPGSVPTTAEAAMNPGLSSLELGAMADPAVKTAVRGQQMSNMGARLDVLNDIAKTPEWRDQMTGVRSMMSEPLYTEARALGLDQNAAAALRPQIDNLMSRLPTGTLDKAKDLARQAGVSIDDPRGSIQGLQYLKWAIGDRLKQVGQGALQGEERRLTSQSMGDLNSLLEDLSPKFQEANRAFATWSKPLNAMDVAQALKDKLVPALMDYAGEGAIPTRVRSQSFAEALRNAPATIQAATGQRGRELGDVLPSYDADRLTAVAQDLARRASSEDLAKTVGSTTAQNLATRQAMRRVAGPIGMPESWLESALSMSTIGRPLAWTYGKFVEPGVNQTLARFLSDPIYAQSILSKGSTLPTWIGQAYGKLLSAGSAGAPSGYLAQ